MLNISQSGGGTQISLTRGDTAVLALHIKNADGSAYTVTENDIVRVQVRKRPITGSTVSGLVFEGQIEIVDGVPIWTITPEQSTMDAGAYYWDAEITTASGYVCTYLSGTLVIMAEVTVTDDGD